MKSVETIGVIGGGQLGRMFALDAKRMGYDVVTLDPQEHSPCGQIADEQIVAAYDDRAAIEELGRRSDVITYEFENIDIGSVLLLESLSHRVTPASSVLRVTQDRLLEKQFAREAGLATTEFAPVSDADDLMRAAEQIGFPAIIKTVRGGYDGKGQWRADSLEQAQAGLASAAGADLVFERLVPLACELSVIATRNAGGDIIAYPVAENTHDRGILTMTVAPARVEPAIAQEARRMAEVVGRGLGIVGTYCVEFFLSTGGALLVNEIAPRPHNSGHYTIDVTPCSQYEQHVRAICDLPLSPPRLLANAIMINVLGDGRGNHLAGVAELLSDPSIVLHVYGKRHAVARRKMGHFTMLVDGPVDEAAIAREGGAREAALDAGLMQYLDEAFYVFVTLIALIDPISAAAVFAALTEGRSDKDRAEIARRATIVAGVTLIVFAFVGEALLNALGVKIGAFKIAGGLLLLKVGFNMVFAPAAHREMANSARQNDNDQSDPSVFPLAIPIITGPGALTASVALVNPTDTHNYSNGVIFVIVALLVIGINYLFMLGAEKLTTRIGQTGIDAVSRIIGIIIAAIAVELVVDGVTSLTHLVMS